MEVRYSTTYKKFFCIASECEDTCCKSWAVAVDPKIQRVYRRVKGNFGKKLRQAVDFKQGCFRMSEKGCFFLDTEGLCEIYQKLGAERMPKTCQRYPRHMEDYGQLREYMLMLSCPEAARIILGNPKEDRFILLRKGKSVKTDGLLADLIKARETAFFLLKDRNHSLESRAAAVLSLAHDIQNRLNVGRKEEIPEISLRYTNGKELLFAKIEKSMRKEYLGSRYAARKACMEMLKGLETVIPKWPVLLTRSMEILYRDGREAYLNRRPAFLKCFQELAVPGEHFLISFVYTYFLGSIYDEKLWNKAAFCVFSYLTVKELCFARWLETGSVSPQDMVEIVHLYSREIEHSDRNLTTLENMMEGHKILALESMFYMLGEEISQ